MIEVTGEKFWAFVMGATFDIVSGIDRGTFPYTSTFKARYGGVVGRIVDKYVPANQTAVVGRKYFLEAASAAGAGGALRIVVDSR